MSWVISSNETSVTFPVAPQNCTDRNPIVETDFPVGGQQSVVVCEGLDVRILTLKGFFYVASQNKSYLDSTFCDPLLGFNGQIVTLACPTVRYNGSWLLIVDTLDDKAEGLLQRYFYTLILKQGAAFVVHNSDGSTSENGTPQTRTINVNKGSEPCTFTITDLNGHAITEVLDGIPFKINITATADYLPYINCFNSDDLELFGFDISLIPNGDTRQIIVTQYEDCTWRLTD